MPGEGVGEGPMSKCIRCGSEQPSPGALYGPTRLSFRPDGTRFLTLETGDVLTKASMCRECGFVEILGDVNKLRRLIGDPGKGPAPSA
jgi:hypothetical protein